MLVFRINKSYEKIIKSGVLSQSDYDIILSEEKKLISFINRMMESGKLSGYEGHELLAYSREILMKLTENIKSGDLMKEGLVKEMSGEIIETQAHLLYAAGEKNGEKYGKKYGEKYGEKKKLISLIRKKIIKNKSLTQTADELEQEIDEIEELYELVKNNMDKSDDELTKLLLPVKKSES